LGYSLWLALRKAARSGADWADIGKDIFLAKDTCGTARGLVTRPLLRDRVGDLVLGRARTRKLAIHTTRLAKLGGN